MKSKKKKKKKSKKAEGSGAAEASGLPSPPSTPLRPNGSALPSSPSKSRPGAPTSPSTGVHFAEQSQGLFGASTTSFAQPTVAQSARSYLAESSREEPKVKVKTRADPAQLVEPKKKGGFFKRFTDKVKRKDAAKEDAEAGDNNDESDADEDDPAEERVSHFKPVFNHLPQRASALLTRLFGDAKMDEKQGKASMRWDHFVKVSLQG